MIGVFDSGLGGLSVLAAIARALPQSDLTYFADTAHVPYGTKSDDFIRSRVLAIGEHLATLGCNVIVVACNTATAAAVNALRERHPDIPIVGVEPGVKPAAAASKTRRIAVLATESTAKSERLARLIRDHANSVHVHIEPCPGWATRVETLHLDDPLFSAEIAAIILPLLERGIDQLVLGCTHYSFLAPVLKPLLKSRAELVDVADAVARQVSRLVAQPLPSASAAKSDRRTPLLLLQASANAGNLQAALPRLDLDWLMPRIVQPVQNVALP
ncbi:MAG: glutamate racemase [Georgfuchsia sp.]